MASQYSTRSARQSRSYADDGFQKGFYGITGTVQNRGISLLKKKKKKVSYESDIRASCKNMDHYKESADKLHSSLMYLLVESKSIADTLATSIIPSNVVVDPGYQHFADYLATYELLQKHGFKEGTKEEVKIKLDPLEPAIRASQKLAEEQEKYARNQLETLKPLTKFISDEFWEFAKQKHIYLNALEKCEAANNATKSMRPGSMEPSQSGQSYDKVKDDAKGKMMALVSKINGKKDGHATCVLKFAKQATEWHKNAASILAPFNVQTTDEMKPTKHVEGEMKSKSVSCRNKKNKKSSREQSS